MALTSRDETDLLLPLFDGMNENPRFATFLERLRRRTGALHVTLIFDDPPSGIDTVLGAGPDLAARAGALGLEPPHLADRTHLRALRAGRTYSLGEFVDHDPVARAARARWMAQLGLADERVVRIAATDAPDCWLAIYRPSACSAADSALLATLAPYVALAVRTMAQADARWLERRIAEHALAHGSRGWFALDGSARLARADAPTQAFWESLVGIAPRPGERLPGITPQADRALLSAAGEMAANPGTQALPVMLRDAPRVPGLLVPFAPTSVLAAAEPACLLLLDLPAERAPEALARFATIHGLPRREAELALALGDGLSIAQAAQRMGLTLETARNYSKKVYARLGVRGQVELVRLVEDSRLLLA